MALRIAPLSGVFAAAAILTFQPAIGQVQSAAPRQARLSETQRQQLFEARRSLEKKSHAGRIAILQEADRCITAATNAQGYRQCEEKERQARHELRSSLRGERQALLSQYGLSQKAP
jgi:hypothetical protein